MNQKIKTWTENVIQVIKNLQKDYSKNKGLILTEGDLECILFKSLSEHKCFSNISETKTKGWKSGFVHSQVTWFKPGRDSGFRVDLTICEPANINIETLENIEDWPNKGFFHDGAAVALEVKFIRHRDHKKISNDAQMDYIKVAKNLKTAKEFLIENNRYKNVTVDDISYIVLIVCKTDLIYKVACDKLQIAVSKHKCPKNVFPIVLSHDEIFEINELIGSAVI